MYVSFNIDNIGFPFRLSTAIDKELLKEVMLSKVPAKVHEINLKAYDLGYKYSDTAKNA